MTMQIYKVGGCIRDKLLGVNNNDTDYVVVGASIEDMLALGFIPVGRDFPVFLHPKTHEEYALARKERKNGLGYKEFKFYTDKNVTLEEDLKRRDITINAMAEDELGNIIDPFAGRNDLKHKIIRHVSDAFAEDPLRVLRVARFSAKLNFTIAPETFNLMIKIAKDKPELLSLSNERIFFELSKVLNSNHIATFFKILHDCGVLKYILTEFNVLFKIPETFNKLTAIFDIISSGVVLDLQQKESLLYYIICYKLPVDEYMQVINKSLLPRATKSLTELLVKLYPVLINFTQIIQQQDVIIGSKIILELMNKLDPLRQNFRFENFSILVRIIAVSDNILTLIESSLARINYIIFMFKQIDYNKIFMNNNDNKKEIVYNTKLEIINNYIMEQQNA